jgi:hypothetical protein
MPTFTPLLFHTDAYQFAVGAILTQIFADKEKVVQYLSNKRNATHQKSLQSNASSIQSYLPSIYRVTTG